MPLSRVKPLPKAIRPKPPASADPPAAKMPTSVPSPIGWLPRPDDLDLAELDMTHQAIVELLVIDHEEWQTELAAHDKFFQSLGGVVPEELLKQREKLAARFAV